MLNLTIMVSVLVMLWAGCWQVSADDIEGVAYGAKVLLKSDGTWAYSEESIKAKTKDGKAVELRSDNTWEYVEVELKGAITFRIAALNDYQRAEIKRDDEGKAIGVEVWTGCAITLEVGNTLDIPIKVPDFFSIVGETTNIDWTFYSDPLVPPGENRLFDEEPVGFLEGGVLYPNRTELAAEEKNILIESLGCKAIEGMMLLLLTESLTLETVPPAATDVDILSVVQTLPNEFVNFETKWRR